LVKEKLNVKRLVIGILFLSSAINLCSSNWVFGKEKLRLTPGELEATVELLRECNGALETCERQHVAKDNLIQAQQSYIETQMRELEAKRNEASSIMENKALWFGLGFAAALAAGYVMRKQ
jgi:hypothetical protein